MNKEAHMIADSLSHTLRLIEQYQNDCPTNYSCIETELNCLKDHMRLVIKYLDPLTDNDLNMSLPKTLDKAKGTTPVITA